MKMYIGGEWTDKDVKVSVLNPYDGSVIDTVPSAATEDVDSAIASAVRGAAVMAKVPAYERFLMLRRAADLLEERTEEFARTITLEEGKVIAESRTEVGRAVQTACPERRPSASMGRACQWTRRPDGRASWDLPYESLAG